MLNSNLEDIILSYLDLSSYMVLCTPNNKYPISRYENLYIRDIIKIKKARLEDPSFSINNIDFTPQEFNETGIYLLGRRIMKKGILEEENIKIIQQYIAKKKMYNIVVSLIKDIMHILKKLEIIDVTDDHISHMSNVIQFGATLLTNFKNYEFRWGEPYTDIKREVFIYIRIHDKINNLAINYVNTPGGKGSIGNIPLTPIWALLESCMRLLISLKYKIY